MQKYFNTVANRAGAAVSNATVTVKTQAGAYADLYSDNGITTKANPVRTDSNGYFEFYAADGRYNLTIAGAGIGSQVINDVLIEDPADGTASSSTLVFQQSGTGAASRTAQDKLRDAVSAKDFGAKADANAITGVGTDDAAAIQAAINAKGSAGDRQLTVHLPDGTYYCSTDILVPEGVAIVGGGAWKAKVHFAAGKGFRLIAGGSYDLPPMLRGFAAYSSGGTCVNVEYLSGAEITNMWFGGTVGVGILGTADINISDNVFDGTANGIVFSAGAICNNIQISNNQFTGNAYAITLKNARDVRITGNGFRGDASHNIHIYSPSASNTLKDVVIANNTFYTIAGTGATESQLMKLTGTLDGFSITGNVFDGCRADGIYSDAGSVTGMLIAGNQFRNIGGNAIYFINVGDKVSVKHNVFYSGIGGNVLKYRTAGNLVFNDNEVWSANEAVTTGINGAALDIGNATLFVAKNNVVATTNATYGILIRSDVAATDIASNRLAGTSGAITMFNSPSYKNVTSQNNQGNVIAYDGAIPTAGTWRQGDIVYNIIPAASGFVGWVCVASGVPGTWKTFGAISA